MKRLSPNPDDHNEKVPDSLSALLEMLDLRESKRSESNRSESKCHDLLDKLNASGVFAIADLSYGDDTEQFLKQYVGLNNKARRKLSRFVARHETALGIRRLPPYEVWARSRPQGSPREKPQQSKKDPKAAEAETESIGGSLPANFAVSVAGRDAF